MGQSSKSGKSVIRTDQLDKTGGFQPADLRELMREGIDAPVCVTHLSAEEYTAIDKQRQELAETLGRRLYELTNIERETELAVYLETINRVVLDTTSEENQSVLKSMQQYFVDTYGEEIRRLGHSPLVVDQIVHRTGRDTREIVLKTLNGFDVQALAARIRKEDRSFSDNAPKVAARIMYNLTHRQIREMRSEYARLPGCEIAALIYSSLRRTDFRNKPYPDGDTIRYIFLYRSAKEIAQIECQYNELYHFNRHRKSELCLREEIQQRFSEEEAQALLTLMEGFQPGYIADLIYARIQDYAGVSEGLENTSGLHNDFAGHFRRAQKTDAPWQKEIAARPAIEHIVFDLTPEQFSQVRQSVQQRYDIDLTPELFPNIRSFCPRRTALNVYRACMNVEPRSHFRRAEQYLSERELRDVRDEYRLSKENELSSIITARAEEKKALEALGRTSMALSPLAYLTPAQLQDVRTSFRSVIGSELDVFVRDTAENICRGELPRYVADFIEVSLSGLARQPVHADVFHLFASKTKRAALKRRENQKAALIAHVPKLAQAVEEALTDSSATSLLRQLRRHSTEELFLLEELFVESSPGAMPFLKALESSLAPEVLRDIQLIFEDIDLESLIQEIHESPIVVARYIRLEPGLIEHILNRFESEYQISLYNYVRSRFTRTDSATQKERALCLLFCFAPDVQNMHAIVKSCSENSFQEKSLLPILETYKADAKTLEACYNLYFQDFCFFFEKDARSFLRSLRELASANKISRELMARAILLLEHVPSHVSQELHDLLQDRALRQETLNAIHDLLRLHYSHVLTVKRSFNALDPDFTLRETLYQLQLPLDDINKTILIVDGFDPDAIANSIHGYVQESAGEELGARICKLLSPQSSNRVPRDPNWTSEMHHQIRCSYERLHGRTLIADLVRKKVPLKGTGINAIAYLLYGAVSKTAIDLFKEFKSGTELSPERLRMLLSRQTPRLRARVVAMYDAYFVSLKQSAPLRETIKNTVADSLRADELLAMIAEAEAELLKKENIETDSDSKEESEPV